MRNIVLAQRKERDELLSKTYLPRDYQEERDVFLTSSLIKLITGPRRAGKSVSALLLLRDRNFAYLNFDDELLLEKFDEDLVMQALAEVYPNFEYLLLDEIQNLEHWDMWVSKLYRRGCNLIITGSNAKLLSSEMATALTGRYLEMEVLPFSLSECLRLKGQSATAELPDERARLMLQTEDYMHYGGYPETVNNREITELYKMGTYLVSMFGNPFTYSSLTDDLGFSSKSTVQKFCDYLQQTFLFFFLPRYNNKLKLMQKAPQKVYVVDNGFMASSAFQTSENRGRLLENLVFTELLRRKKRVGDNIFYYRSRNDRETDFVIREGFNITQLIQVCFDLSNKKTEKREVDAITECAAELGCNNLLIITWDQEMTIQRGNTEINVVPYYKWCLIS